MRSVATLRNLEEISRAQSRLPGSEAIEQAKYEELIKWLRQQYG
ncbi:MAG: hypothetical protein ABII09_03710 [Planctomycetota bacterium]